MIQHYDRDTASSAWEYEPSDLRPPHWLDLGIRLVVLGGFFATWTVFAWWLFLR